MGRVVVTATEQPIWFPSGSEQLFGIVHLPDVQPAELGVVFLNSGPQNRAGPQRIYVRAARRFAEAGILCLRMDLPGVGESPGEFPAGSIDCYDPKDARGAIDLLHDRFGVEKIILLGICAGARVAVRAAVRDARVQAVVAWSAPIISGPPDMPVAMAGDLSEASARRHLAHWARRLIEPRTWVKYLSSADARAEWAAKLRRVLPALLPSATRATHSGAQAFIGELETLFASRRPVLVAYGERDIGPLAEFQERFGDAVRGGTPGCGFFVVSRGDHTFTNGQAARTVIDQSLTWMLGLQSPSGAGT